MIKKPNLCFIGLFTGLAALPFHAVNAGAFDTLTSYWPFDEGQGFNVFDLVGLNDGTLCGGTVGCAASFTGGGQDMAPAPGNADALTFPAGDGYVDVLDSDTLRPQAVTVAAWVKTPLPQFQSSFKYILAKNLNDNHGSYGLYTDRFGVLRFYVGYGPEGGPGVDDDFTVSAGSDAIYDGGWHHVAGTYGGPDLGADNFVRLYVDGQQVGTPEEIANAENVVGIYYDDFPVNPTALGSDLSIGNWGDYGLGLGWGGQIDGVMVFDSALAPEQIATLAAGDAVLQGCPSASGDLIQSLEATSDGTTITVTMSVCGPVITRANYRAHFDYEAPFYDSLDRNGDGFVDAADFCVATDDAGMQFRRATPQGDQITGPGTITLDETGGLPVFTYTLNYTDVIRADGTPLLPGDEIALWVDVNNTNRKDRAPVTDSGNGCDEPENDNEVIRITLN